MTSYLLAAPAAEPVSLDEAKAFLRLDRTDDDTLVTTLVTAARLHLESVTGRALIAQGWRLVLDDWPPGDTICLPIGPLISLTSITGYDAEGEATAMALDGVLWDVGASPPRLFLPTGFGPGPVLRPRQGVEIDYVAGYGEAAADVPAALRQALLTLVAYWYENRDAVIIAGSGSVVPAGLDLMLAPYRSIRL